jgi:OHCU decarboxylase
VSHTLAEINALDRAEFVRVIGPVFEHSPWIAGRVANRRPFGSVTVLHDALCATVELATLEEQLALIRAHPDLVGRAGLTPESKGEQTAAGLANLSRDEVALFDRYNRDYQARFGFPFVICARLNKKDAILAAFPLRLQNSAERERAAALAEIYKIARLRLNDLIGA